MRELAQHDGRRFAIEEEFFFVDAISGELVDAFDLVFPGGSASAGVVPEVWGCQVEILTDRPCFTVDELRNDMSRSRDLVAREAARHGLRVLAVSAHPFADLGYQRLRLPEHESGRIDRLVAQGKSPSEQIIVSGMHVHVGIDDDPSRRRAMAVLNRARRDIYTLLAVSASSPFSRGADTALASHRSREYYSYPPDHTTDLNEHYLGHLLDHMTDGKPTYYAKWDIRLSSHLPTIEIRTPDVQVDLEDGLLIAALARAIVRTAASDVDRGLPQLDYPLAHLERAKEMAMRSGFDGDLFDVEAEVVVPARRYVVETFLGRLEKSLHELGDWEFVAERLHTLSLSGGGARRQRRLFLESVREYGERVAWQRLVASLSLPVPQLVTASSREFDTFDGVLAS
jgi:glutamate---cysteine ligase / carboxylate-amine ligase